MALHVRDVAAERGDKACEVDAENIVFEDRGRILRFRPSKAPRGCDRQRIGTGHYSVCHDRVIRVCGEHRNRSDIFMSARDKRLSVAMRASLAVLAFVENGYDWQLAQRRRRQKLRWR